VEIKFLSKIHVRDESVDRLRFEFSEYMFSQCRNLVRPIISPSNFSSPSVSIRAYASSLVEMPATGRQPALLASPDQRVMIRFMKTLLLLLFAGLAFLFTVHATEGVPTLPLGATAPDFNLPGVDGRNWTLKDFADAKILVVVFTCNHCPTAQDYQERIKKIVTDYKSKGVAVVAINPNDANALRFDEIAWSDLSDTFPEMKIRAQDRHYNFPYLYDGDTETVAKAYGPVATPHVFVFDAARKLRYEGAIDDSQRLDHVTRHYLQDALDALLAGRTPAVTQTKLIGCSIKWASKESQVQDYLAKIIAEPVSVAPADAATLAALRTNSSGKVRLVNFWATWCAPCMAEFNEFVTINRIYRIRSFEMVTVAVNDPDEQTNVLRFLKKQQASNRNLIFASTDRDKLINAFDPEWQGAVPFTVLIDPSGKVVYREDGSIDVLAIKRAITKSLDEFER
jgi:thiol-disulfide isomerase/thioredoxin